MKINKLSAALALLAINGAWASQVSIDEVIVSDNLYPEKFAAELQNNLNFFRDGVGVDVAAKVPYDTIFIRDGKTVDPAYYVNSTEIGFYLNVLVEMEKAGNKDALVRISEVLDTMDNAPNWNGLFFWPYNIVDGQLETTKEGVVPAVDNANFVFSLLGVAGAFLDSEEPAKQKIVQRIDSPTTYARNDNRKKFTKMKSKLDAQCNRCNYKFACQGGCPKHRVGDSNSRHNVLCDGYFAYFSYIEPYMDFMCSLLKREQPASTVMDYLHLIKS